MASLKELVIKGTGWTFVGYGASQVLRLGSNLVLTRLLFPEVFGLSALVTVFMTGLQMFSDVGIGPSIIQSDKGDDPVFLNTAWTIQVIRGVALWLCACLGAYPFASFYQEPQLATLIIVSGFSAVISGFNSTALFSANKHMRLKGLTLIQVGSQLMAVCVMIVWAMISPTVWVVVVGGLTSSFMTMLASHLWLAEFRHRFVWDKASLKALFHFGRWIFVGTVLGFVVNYIDRLIVGKFMSLADLGVYSIAAMMAKVVEKIYFTINTKVVFPVYSKLKDLPIEELKLRIRKIRLCLIATFFPLLAISIIFGEDIITLLFDQRYHDAGWMLQVLSVGHLVTVGMSIGPIFYAYGDSLLVLKMLFVKSIIFVTLMVAGGIFYGIVGIVAAISITPLLFYPFQVVVYRRFKLWQPSIDLIVLFASVIIILGALNHV